MAVRIAWNGSGQAKTPALRSGEHQLLRVNPDASLTIANFEQSLEFTIGWLGIELSHPRQAAIWLDRRLQPHGRIEIRFDRRRLDDAGKLVAYIFQDEELLNETLINEGLASEATHPSDHAPIARRLRQAEPESQ